MSRYCSAESHLLKTQNYLVFPQSPVLLEIAQSEAVFNLLKNWNFLDVTIALVFDATASNTG